jgi:hypothetical protein
MFSLPYSNIVPGIILGQVPLDQQAPGHVASTQLGSCPN